MTNTFPNLAGVLSRPIRWDLIAPQYDEMVKHAVALKLGTATPEAILKRFNSYNVTHPTYRALAELGKVEKTIYLCEYLSSLALRHEVEAGLNVVERWNEANDFIRYGRQGLFTTNSREQQEISALCLQLVQNCLMLINSILVEQTVAHHQLLEQFSGDDRRAKPGQNILYTSAEITDCISHRGGGLPLRRLHEFEEPQLLPKNGQLHQARRGLGAIHNQGFLWRQWNQCALGRGKTRGVKHAVANVGDFLFAPIIAAPILCQDHMVQDRA